MATIAGVRPDLARPTIDCFLKEYERGHSVGLA